MSSTVSAPIRTVSMFPSRPPTAAPPKILGPRPVSHRDWERLGPIPTDIIAVRNISVSATVGVDGWGRRKYQPVLISVRLSLAQSFESAAQTDQVDGSTVHYGTLSKKIVEAVEAKGRGEIRMDVLARLVEQVACETVPFPALVQAFEVEILLPKGSLLGGGAGITYSRDYGSGNLSRVLFLRDVRIPTVVGINAHEREMKQVVVANVEIDPVTRQDAAGRYNEVEQILVKVVEESSFGTLESLATKVASILIKHFVFPMSPGAGVRVRVEKPSAVAFADAPAVEIVRSSSQGDPFAMRMWDECRYKTPPWIPFPLRQRLDDWLESQRQKTVAGSASGTSTKSLQ